MKKFDGFFLNGKVKRVFIKILNIFAFFCVKKNRGRVIKWSIP